MTQRQTMTNTGLLAYSAPTRGDTGDYLSLPHTYPCICTHRHVLHRANRSPNESRWCIFQNTLLSLSFFLSLHQSIFCLSPFLLPTFFPSVANAPFYFLSLSLFVFFGSYLLQRKFLFPRVLLFSPLVCRYDLGFQGCVFSRGR